MHLVCIELDPLLSLRMTAEKMDYTAATRILHHMTRQAPLTLPLDRQRQARTQRGIVVRWLFSHLSLHAVDFWLLASECKWFATPGGCWRGDSCKFKHSSSSSPSATTSPSSTNTGVASETLGAAADETKHPFYRSELYSLIKGLG